MDQPDFLVLDILDEAVDELETDRMPAARALRVSARRRYERVAKAQALADVVPEAPGPGEQIHLVSESKYDFGTWIPQIIGWVDTVDELYCSTWVASQKNVVDLVALWDAGKIPRGKVSVLTGKFFKRRETSVYCLMLDAIRERGGRFRALYNHAKVLLLANAAKNAWFTVEGSANLTGNPQVEQYVITNDRELYQWHREWMEELLTAPPNRSRRKAKHSKK